MEVNLPNGSVKPWIDGINHEGVCISKFIDEATRNLLLEELKDSSFVQQPKIHGNYHGNHGVSQEYSAVVDFSSESLFRKIAKVTNDELTRWLQSEQNCVFTTPLNFTDLVVQRYPSGQGGIGVHKDGKRFINLVAVLVLEGYGDFCFCDNREGLNSRVVQNDPGDLILMRGVGFCGSEYQPFHFVNNIRAERTTFGMRQKLSI